jgi:hypothetical protein
MTTISVTSAKFGLAFKAGQLPDINPDNPSFVINLDGLKVQSKITAKAARKLKAHAGGAVLSGKLVVQDGDLVLLDAGIQFLDVQPPASQP